MSDRDRLIELLKPHVSGTACLCESGSCELTSCRDCKARRLSDHLLANGVIVPPCKVGETVYCIEYNFGIIEEYTVYGYTTKSGKLALLVRSGIYTSVISEWFLTKEEAEEKLRELKDNA